MAYATKYVSDAGNDSTGDGSYATPWATMVYAETQVRGTNTRILGKCGSSEKITGSNYLRLSLIGSSSSDLAGFGSYYDLSGAPVEGVSGSPYHIYGDYASIWTAGATCVVGDFYSPQKYAENGFWYKVITAGTFGSTAPTWPTTEGATVVSGTAVLSARGITNTGGSDQYSSGFRLIGTNSADTPNNCIIRDLWISNGRGQAFASSEAISYSLKYIEFRNNIVHDMADSAFQPCQSGLVLNNEFIVDSNTIYRCGKAYIDGKGSPSRPGPGWIRLRGHANTTSLTRQFTNNVCYSNWRELIIVAQNTVCTGNLLQGNHTNFYPVVSTVSGHTGPQNVEIARNIILGSSDTWNQRYAGYCGYGVMTSSESTALQTISGLNVHDNLMAFLRGGLYIAPNAPLGAFKSSKFIGNTVIDCQNSISMANNAGDTGSVIQDNILYSYTVGVGDVSGSAPPSLTKGYNSFTSSGAAGNLAGTGDVYTDPLLYKNTGWQTISAPYDVTYSAFQVKSTSPAKAAGLTVSGYTTDYLGATKASPPNIGGIEAVWTAGGGTSTVPTYYTSDQKHYYHSAAGSYVDQGPSNVVDGNLILMLVTTYESSASSGSNITPPSGFTQIVSSRSTSSAAQPEAVAFYKVASSEPSTYSWSSTMSCSATFGRVDGQKSTSPITTSNSNNTTSSVTSLAVNGVTTVADNAMLVMLVAVRTTTQSNAFTASGSMSVVVSAPTSGSHQGAGVETIASHAATGTRTWSWTGAGRAAGLSFNIEPGTSSTDITPPVFSVTPSVTSNTDVAATVTATLTDATTTNIKWYAAAYRMSAKLPSSAQVISAIDGDGVACMGTADSKTNVASGVSNTLTVSGLTDPKIRIGTVAKDNSAGANTQLAPTFIVKLLSAPTGYSYTESTVDSDLDTIAANSFLAGLNVEVGDVMVFQSTTTPSGLAVAVSGNGTITITRNGNTTAQTFTGYLWSQATGATQTVTFKDPFYQSSIGPFGNNTRSKLVNATVYVVAALEDSDGVANIPAHDPENISLYVTTGAAVAVALDSSGLGVYYNTIAGNYRGFVYNSSGSYIGVLGSGSTIGITVA